jgi:hypothetical protein
MNHPQCCKLIAMVRPAAFAFNAETAANNFFQREGNVTNIHSQALKQFDEMVQLLKTNGIDVLVLNDTEKPKKPDAIFPNNWFSCNNGVLTVFPMEALNRRLEKRPELISLLQIATGIDVIYDLSQHESKNIYLEGTGSIVFDHVNKIAYACYSSRSCPLLFEEHCKKMNYLPIGFQANDEINRSIYHTNVMMSVGERFAVVCLDAVSNEIDRHMIIHELTSTGHEIVEISFEQMNCFAGNMLEVLDRNGNHVLIMSSTAYSSLNRAQTASLEKFAKIVTPDVSIIEKAAGGSVRCMMAELFML